MCTRVFTESNDDEKYELDEYVDINLPPVIENGKVVYQTENELKDILNTCWLIKEKGGPFGC